MQRGEYYFECLIFSGEKEYVLLPSIPAEIQERILSRFTLTNLQVIKSKEECPDLLISAISSFKLAWIGLRVSMSQITVYGSFNASELLSNLFENRGFERLSGVPEWVECQRSVFKEADSVAAMVYLIERNPNISYLGDGTEFLHLAVAKKCEPLVQCLLANGADIEARTLHSNRTPLHLAIADHPSEIMAKILIEHGADTNATGDASKDYPSLTGLITPLRMCIESIKFDEPARVSVVKLLLENGANLNAHDDSRKSLLVSASLNSPGSLALILERQPRLDDSRHGRILQALLTAHCLRSDKEAMKINASIDLLLAYGFEIDRDAAKSKEVFFKAIRLDNIEMVARLLKLGSNPTDEVNGVTALQEAAMFSSESMVRLLLGFGADMNAKTPWAGKTALDLAANHGNLGVVKCLLARGAKLVDHPFLLHEAVTAYEAFLGAKHQNIVETVKYIIELGADVHAPDHNGRLPITLALSYNLEEVVFVLFHHGARLGVLYDFCLAIEGGLSRAVLFYLQNGIDVEKNAEEVYFAIESQVADSVDKCQDMVTFFLSFYDPCIFKDVLHRRLTIYSDEKSNTIRLELLKYMNLKTILECILLEDISNDAVSYETIEAVPQNRKALYQHVFALIHADLTVNNNVNWQESPVVSNILSLFGKEWSERCKAELSAMKKKTVGSSDVSFHDILDGAPSQILRYLRNEDILESCESYEDFPMYADMISQRVRKAILRKTLLTRGVQMLNFLFEENPKLPFPIVERIGDYLSNQELLILSSVFRLPSDIFPPITLDYLGIKKNPDHGS